MTSRRFLLLLAVLVAGCSTGEVRFCPDERAEVADGAVKKQLFRALADPTEGGSLKGKPPAGTDRPRKMILLLDYSGSMYGGFGKPRPAGCPRCAVKPPFYFGQAEFQTLLARWLDAATPPGTDMRLEILLFNDRLWRVGESVEPFTGSVPLRFDRRISAASGEQVAAWLRSIKPNPSDVDARAPLTTRSREALEKVLDAVVDEAVLWLITDNIVDTRNGVVSAEEAERNLQFYEALRADPRVQMVSAYPLLRPETCTWMCGTSLFAYGIYASRFERPGSPEFHRLGGTAPDGRPSREGLLWNDALRAIAAEYSGRAANVEGADLAGVPLRLKPIDTEVLSLDFQLHGGQALRCDQRAEYGDELRCAARIVVRNTLRHQTVESAELSLSNEVLLPRKQGSRRRLPWASAVCAGQMRLERWRVQGGREGGGRDPIQLGPLAPLRQAVVDVLFHVPAIHVDTRRSTYLADVALTPRILLDGRIVAEIRDIRTRLFLDPERLEGVYGAAALPGIFRRAEQARIRAEYPAAAVVSNNGQVLGLLVLLCGGSLLGIAVLVVLRFQRIQLTVVVNGVETARLSMPRVSRRPLEIDGAVRAEVRRGWSAVFRLVPRAGNRLRKEGSTWLLGGGEASGEEHRIDVRRGWSGLAARSLRSARVGRDERW
jgi:hypothetical protein